MDESTLFSLMFTIAKSIPKGASVTDVEFRINSDGELEYLVIIEE